MSAVRMQIRTITVNNFKSLVEFRLELAKFTCLIGLNGVGKSTVVQFIDFLAQQVRGDLGGWLEERSWQAKDINSRLSPRKNIDFDVRLAGHSGDQQALWVGSFNTTQLRCTTERISVPGAVLQVQEGRYDVSEPQNDQKKSTTGVGGPIAFDYEGSLLSQLKEGALPDALRQFKRYFESVNSLDLLSPERLRQRTREAAGSLGLGGQKLSAFVHELGPAERKNLNSRLREAYQQLDAVNATSLRSGWKQLEIREVFNGKKLVTEARHVADGMLRMIAILAELQTEHGFLLFDEIENGINPELVEFVLDALVTAEAKQVLVTTHSPLILNYLDDDVARRGVMYLYKTREGHTQAIRFFDIPSVAGKLTVMGPGEAFADTNLTTLQNEINTVTKGA
jgi:predicted ATPase